MRKKVMVLLAGLLAVNVLAGCSLMKPKNAEQLVEKYAEALSKEGSCSINGTIKMNVGIAAQGVTLNIPVELDVEAKTDGGKYTYMDMSLKVEASGESINSRNESYMVLDRDEVDTYSRTDGGEWVHSTTDDSGLSDLVIGDISPEMFKEAELEESDDAYKVTLNLGSAYKGDELSEVFSNKELFANVDTDEVVKQLLKANVIYKFDKKTYLLKEIELEDFEFSQDAEQNGVTAAVTMSLSFQMELDDYGELDKGDYKVPDDVVDSAVEESGVKESGATAGTPELPLETEPEEPAATEEPKELAESEEPVATEEPAEPEESAEPREPTATEEPEEPAAVPSDDRISIVNYDGGVIYSTNCPNGFTIEEVSEYGTTLKGSNGVNYYIGAIVEPWASEYLTTGDFTRDEEFYTYEDVSVIESYETASGTAYVLKREYTLAGFDDVDTDYVAMIDMGEESPCLCISKLGLDEMGIDIGTLAHELFH